MIEPVPDPDSHPTPDSAPNSNTGTGTGPGVGTDTAAAALGSVPVRTPRRLRDWIAVDQLLHRLLDAAEDDFERDVLRLAARASGGPDPEIPGGGPEWAQAVHAARTEMQIVLTATMDAPPPLATVTALPGEIASAVAHADLNPYDAERLTERLAELVTAHLTLARRQERTQIADWLAGRAGRTRPASTLVDERARALSDAAALLRETLRDTLRETVPDADSATQPAAADHSP